MDSASATVRTLRTLPDERGTITDGSMPDELMMSAQYHHRWHDIPNPEPLPEPEHTSAEWRQWLREQLEMMEPEIDEAAE